MTNEIWKWIKGYEWLYQISNLWNVRSFKNNRRWLKKTPSVLKKRYNKKNKSYMVSLWKCREELIYRLVAQSFMNFDLDSWMYICHKDDNRLNNCVDNLFIWTQKENIKDCISKWRLTQKKLSSLDLLYIKKNYIYWIRPIDISRFIWVSPTHCVRIWKHYTNDMIFNY